MPRAAADIEPSYDPVSDMDDAIDASRRKAKPVDPMPFLLELLGDGWITAEERDAGEMVASLADCANGKATAYRLRDRAGIWADRPVSRRVAPHDLLESWLLRLDADEARAIRQTLVAEEPVVEKPDDLISGLGALARSFWGQPAERPVAGLGASFGSGSLGENDATPERLRHANDNTVTPEGARLIRSGFMRMKSNGELDPDPRVNEILYAAGLRYQSEHHVAGMDPLAAPNYEQAAAAGWSANIMSERMLNARRVCREAQAAMGGRYVAIVDAVVLQNRTLSSLGTTLSKFKSLPQITAELSERLNAGLRLLAVHYGLMMRRRAA